MVERSYFDHNATTPLDPRVAEAMLPWLEERFGNPSSAHCRGREARETVESARREVAEVLGADPEEIVFTASGSEANNSVVFEVARASGREGKILLSSLEHPSVTRAAERCVGEGMTLQEIDPGPDGVVDAEKMIGALGPETRLVCLMLANNVVGTLQPVREVASAARERGIPVLCDAVQALGKVPVEPRSLAVDYLSLGGHKFHGPLGGAALWIHPGAPFEGWLVGGGQEGGRRGSTPDVPAVAGLGEACRLAREELSERREHLETLRERLEEGLSGIPDARIHAVDAPRLPHTTCVSFRGLRGTELGPALDRRGFQVSTGPACGSGKPRPPEALLAMGVSEELALGTLRISFGMTNTLAEVERFLPGLEREVQALRSRDAAPA
ncbi:MAG: cysteine desulfurase family protein [Thermoanaerobaculia bacterium]|nr:cysteine desulfurase family protein [Thermoanaerobaculia bacterium]